MISSSLGFTILYTTLTDKLNDLFILRFQYPTTLTDILHDLVSQCSQFDSTYNSVQKVSMTHNLAVNCVWKTTKLNKDLIKDDHTILDHPCNLMEASKHKS
uniref:Uncharacterized protein n=1 Tax=Cacopsylla melanoneura TaxID=428564 RepID=A0A8D8M4V9_9HEMI